VHFVQVGFLCNNACVFCAQGRLRDETPSPSLDALFAQVDAVASGDVVAFVGGEPTLLDALPVLARRARQAGAAHVLVQTNGRRLAAAGYARALADSGVTRLEVALQGSRADMHDHHTGMPGSFKAAITGLRRARAAGLGFVLTTVVTRSNFRHLSEIVRVAHALGARGVALAPVAREGRAASAFSRLAAPSELLRPHVRSAQSLGRVLGLALSGGETNEPPEAFRGWLAGIGVSEGAAPGAQRPQSISREHIISLERLVRPSVGHGLQPSSAMR
jgi:MoaA/NifB/PqqE/SkfB family radical SAM enzyme